MAKKIKKHSVSKVGVVWWNDLEHSKDFEDTFDSFSYGDASATLVAPKKLIRELGICNEAGKLDSLVAELKSISNGVLIGFDS